MFDNIADNQQEENVALNAANPVDFKKIYDATMQMLFKVSYRIVNDEEAAEDLAHDSLIKANEKELTFPSINDAKYWLIRVVKNASINYIKRKERERTATKRSFMRIIEKRIQGKLTYSRRNLWVRQGKL